MPKKVREATVAETSYIATHLGLSDTVLQDHTGLDLAEIVRVRQAAAPQVNPDYDRPAAGVTSMTGAASQRSDDFRGPTTITPDIIALAERNGQTQLLPRLRELRAAGQYDAALVQEVMYGNSLLKLRP